MDMEVSQMRHQPADRAFVQPLAKPRRLVSFRSFALVVGFAALMSASAQVTIPLPGTPVPMTLQSLVLLVAGLTLAPSRAAASMMLYLALGVAGLPVFSRLTVSWFGPTTGFLAGFVLAAWITSLVAGRGGASLRRLLVAGAFGGAVLFACGTAWLGLFGGGDFAGALKMTTVPFLPKFAVQLVIAAVLARMIRGGRMHAAKR